MSKNFALYGQASRETDGFGIDLKWRGMKSNWRAFPGLAGIRRQRRKRADAKLREVAEAPATELEVLSERWSDYDGGESLGVDTVTFDADGAHVESCDLPRCPVCAETVGQAPWWESQP